METLNYSLNINKIHFVTYLELITKFEYLVEYFYDSKIKYTTYNNMYNNLSTDEKLLYSQYINKNYR